LTAHLHSSSSASASSRVRMPSSSSRNPDAATSRCLICPLTDRSPRAARRSSACRSASGRRTDVFAVVSITTGNHRASLFIATRVYVPLGVPLLVVPRVISSDVRDQTRLCAASNPDSPRASVPTVAVTPPRARRPRRNDHGLGRGRERTRPRAEPSHSRPSSSRPRFPKRPCSVRQRPARAPGQQRPFRPRQRCAGDDRPRVALRSRHGQRTVMRYR
jgi:hypothetical protein